MEQVNTHHFFINNLKGIFFPLRDGSFGKITCITIFIFLFSLSSFAQKATWIWYPGDYEIWLSNQMQNRRTDQGSFFPVFWKMDSHYVLMDFHKTFTLQQPEAVHNCVKNTRWK